MKTKRGIYLVANKKSQELCENLVYSIRRSGCSLPIRLIHFGGEKIQSAYVLGETEFISYEDFPTEARDFITNLRSVLTDCPLGYLYRFLAWFSDWDEFIYSDNDIVALCNWEQLFTELANYDVVHADEEYVTNGFYNYKQPSLVQEQFGPNALDSAITAGHIAVRRSEHMVGDINRAVEWFRQYPHIPRKHDQSLLHIAALLGKWNMLNLCKPPHNWLSSWAGDYENTLDIVLNMQCGRHISHIHYSGGNPQGNLAIQELLLSKDTSRSRLRKLTLTGIGFLSGYTAGNSLIKRGYNWAKKRVRQKLAGSPTAV